MVRLDVGIEAARVEHHPRWEVMEQRPQGLVGQTVVVAAGQPPGQLDRHVAAALLPLLQDAAALGLRTLGFPRPADPQPPRASQHRLQGGGEAARANHWYTKHFGLPLQWACMALTSRRALRRSSRGMARRDRDAALVVSCLRRLFRAVHEYSKALHQRAGLSSPQLWALHPLEQEPNLSLKTLSERMFSHPSTVSGVVARLTRRGLVRRETDDSDRRGILLRLTRGGRRLLRAAPPPLQLGLRQALDEMPAGRLHELGRSLDEIARRAEITDVVAPFFA